MFIPCLFFFLNCRCHLCIGLKFAKGTCNWHLFLTPLQVEHCSTSIHDVFCNLCKRGKTARRQKMLSKKCLQDVSFKKCQYGRDFFVTCARFDEVKTLLRVCFMFRTYLRECHASHNTKETTMLTSNERKIYKVQWNLISICFSNSFCISLIFFVLRGASHGTRFSQ